MKIIMILLNLLSFAPPIGGRKPQLPADPANGTGLLIITSCVPGSEVGIEPGHLRGIADKEGVARIPAAAQSEGAEPYTIFAGGKSVDMNGNLFPRESLSGVCPQ